MFLHIYVIIGKISEHSNALTLVCLTVEGTIIWGRRIFLNFKMERGEGGGGGGGGGGVRDKMI